jgi:hypothetical protein
MPATYEKIATTTLGSSAATIDFNSISSAYTDLRLTLVTTKAGYGLLNINGDTGTNYSYTWIDGSGSAAASGRATNDNYFYLSQRPFSTTIPHFITFDFFSYAGSTFKTCLTTYSQDENGSGYVGNQVGLWRSTSAISSLSLSGGTNYLIGTTATLYGILKA